MNRSIAISADELHYPDSDQGSVIAVDTRPLSPLVEQEIVLLAGFAWLLWVDGDGEILSAQKGPLA